MRVAVSVWNHRVSPVFDTARRLLLVDYEDAEQVARAEEAIDEIPLPQRAARLSDLEVDVLICGAISRPLASMLSGAGIKMVPFVAGGVDDVLRAYIEGGLADPRMRMPGCCGRRRRSRNRSAHRRSG